MDGASSRAGAKGAPARLAALLRGEPGADDPDTDVPVAGEADAGELGADQAGERRAVEIPRQDLRTGVRPEPAPSDDADSVALRPDELFRSEHSIELDDTPSAAFRRGTAAAEADRRRRTEEAVRENDEAVREADEREVSYSKPPPKRRPAKVERLKVPHRKPTNPPAEPPSAAAGFTRPDTPIRKVGAIGAGLITVAVVIFALRGNMGSPPPSPSESSLAAKAFALGPEDVSLLSDIWFERTVAALHVATFGLWRGLFGSVSALVTAREAMFAAAVVTGLGIWVLGRRLGLGVVATALSVLIATLTPWAVAAHRLVEPANLAAPWLIAAFLFGTPILRRRLIAVPVTICALIAAATAPVAGLVVLAGLAALVATGDVGSRLRPRLRIALAAVLVVVTVVGTALATGAAGGANWLPPTVPPPSPTSFDLVLAVLAVGAAALAARVRWSLPFAAALVPTAVLAAMPGPARSAAAILALPAAALLIGVVAEAAVRRWTARAPVPFRAVVGTAAATAVVTAALTLSLTAPLSHAGGVDSGPDDARRWLAANVPDSAVLVVDDAMWPALVRAGMQPGRLVSYSGVGNPTAATTAAVDAALTGTSTGTDVFVVGQPPASAEPDASARAKEAYDSSLQLAAFGKAGRRTEVRLVVGDVATERVAKAIDLVVRQDYGRTIASNPRIEMSADARRAMATGEVDPRLMSCLASLAARHTITIGSFPAQPGERINPKDGVLRRTVLITGIDGIRPTAGQPNTELMQRWFDGQQSYFKPAETTLDSAIHLFTVRFDAPSPTGLLPG